MVSTLALIARQKTASFSTAAGSASGGGVRMHQRLINSWRSLNRDRNVRCPPPDVRNEMDSLRQMRGHVPQHHAFHRADVGDDGAWLGDVKRCPPRPSAAPTEWIGRRDPHSSTGWHLCTTRSTMPSSRTRFRVLANARWRRSPAVLRTKARDRAADQASRSARCVRTGSAAHLPHGCKRRDHEAVGSSVPTVTQRMRQLVVLQRTQDQPALVRNASASSAIALVCGNGSGRSSRTGVTSRLSLPFPPSAMCAMYHCACATCSDAPCLPVTR